MFQNLHEGAQPDMLVDQNMFFHADKYPASKYDRRYNAPEFCKVAAINMQVENEEVDIRGSVLRKRGAINLNRNQVFDEFSISQCAYDPRGYVLLPP